MFYIFICLVFLLYIFFLSNPVRNSLSRTHKSVAYTQCLISLVGSSLCYPRPTIKVAVMCFYNYGFGFGSLPAHIRNFYDDGDDGHIFI